MKKRLLALLLAGVLVLALAACGQKTDPPASNPPASGAPASEAPAPVEDGTQGVTDTEIKIANTAAVSGAYAPVGLPFLAGIQGYLDMVNGDGGIDGRKVTFLHKDDEFDPVKGKAYLQEMVEDEDVFAIVGHFGTPVVSATLDDLKEYGIPSVYFATGIGQLFAANATSNEEGFNIFPIQPIYTSEGMIMAARGVGTFGAKKIGIIYTSDDAGKNMMEGAKTQCEAMNVELVAEQVAAGAADVSAAVTSIKGANVDFVIVGAIQATMPTIVKEMASQGMTVPAITTYVNAAVTISQQVSNEISGKFDVYVSSWKVHDEAHAADTELFKKWVDPAYVTNTDAESGWVAAHVFCEGLRRLAEKGETPTWTGYMAALEQAPISIPFGGAIDFASGARTGVQEMVLSKCSAASETGWELVYGLASIQEILG